MKGKNTSFLKNMLRNAVGDGIRRGVSEAVGSAVKTAVEPSAEKLANKTAEQLNNAAETIEKNEQAYTTAANSVFADLQKAAADLSDQAINLIWDTALKNYPKWTYSPIKDTSDDEAEEYISISIYVQATWETIDQYIAVLGANGFAGDNQIQRKKIDNLEYCVDFSFSEPGEECEIHYVINK